jgi:hypothetical protein
MRFYQIQKLIEQEQVDEVRMGSSDFAKFLETPLAKSMKAGFEAEVVFRGLGDADDQEWEPDYEVDELSSGVERIIDFFTEGDFADLSSREADRLRERLYDDWSEWLGEAVSEAFYEDQEEHVRDYILEEYGDDIEREVLEEYLSDELGMSESEIEDLFVLNKQYRRLYSTKDQKKFLEDYPDYEKYRTAVEKITPRLEEIIETRVADSIENQDSDWSDAYDQYMENESDSFDEQDWLDSRGWRYMTDVAEQFSLNWPYMTSFGGGEGGFNESAAQNLADDLTDTLDVKTTVSSGYHSTRRDSETWIFEPDSSLEADDSDDMPVEIVSPPMPLDQTVEIIPKFFKWVKDNDGYVNDSTGFHMSVSMPDYDSERLDFVKLALFLGDEYVLKQFGREANTYTKSAIEKIRQAGTKDPNKIAEYMEKMRSGLDTIAKNNLATSSGFGKYTSINPKNGYVEFRSAGGGDYMKDMKRLQDTLARYGIALNLATNPDLERGEYAKKLYKLLSSGVSGNTDAISLFSRYVAKEMPASALKSHLKSLQHSREAEKRKSSYKFDDQGMPKLDWNGNYEIYNIRSDSTVYGFNAENEDEAKAVLDYWKKNYMAASVDPNNYLVRPNKESNQPTTSEDTVFPFEIRYEINDGGVRTFRENGRNQVDARRSFLERARRNGIDLAKITIHSVEQLR